MRGTGEPPPIIVSGTAIRIRHPVEDRANRSARSIELGTTLAEPCRRGSGRAGCCEHADPLFGRCVPIEPAGSTLYSDLCLILRPPRVAAFRRPELVERESRSVPLVSDPLTGDIL